MCVGGDYRSAAYNALMGRTDEALSVAMSEDDACLGGGNRRISVLSADGTDGHGTRTLLVAL